MMWWEARPTLRRWVFLLIPGAHRWRMRALQRRIVKAEMELFPAWYPELSEPKTVSTVLKKHYLPSIKKAVVTPTESLLGPASYFTLDSICAEYFLPVAQDHACGRLRLNTGKDEFSGMYWAVVSCEGCRQTAYLKLDPRDYWTASRGQMNTDGILYAIKSFFAVTVEEMHHAIEAS